MDSRELCFMTATELAEQLRTGRCSAREVMEAHLAQIARVNPTVNAIITLLPDRALSQADAADAAWAHGEPLGPLHGLPIAHKDLESTSGIRTTFGSPIYRDFVPDQNTLLIDRLQAGGAITIGKTNVPEFGAGSQTFNPLFGPTLNPYDTTKTCGGSSGGAAVALATGMMPIADGSDFGGSLRNPANFCNVVGFRPAPGRVPTYPARLGWWSLSVVGPMARTVRDVALLLSVIAGPDPRAPISIAEPGARFLAPLERDFAGVRIIWSRSLGGLPVDPRVSAVLDARRAIFTALGCIVDEVEPDFTGADEVFKGWRAWSSEERFRELLPHHRHQIKETILQEVEQGLRLTGPELSRLEALRTTIFHRLREFMAAYDYLLCPVSQVPPFSVDQPYVTAINGEPLDSYIDWMRSCYYISITGLPAISVPAGFTANGLPVGLQIVGHHQAEFSVLQLAHAFEQATNCWRQRPAVATS